MMVSRASSPRRRQTRIAMPSQTPRANPLYAGETPALP